MTCTGRVRSKLGHGFWNFGCRSPPILPRLRRTMFAAGRSPPHVYESDKDIVVYATISRLEPCILDQPALPALRILPHPGICTHPSQGGPPPYTPFQSKYQARKQGEWGGGVDVRSGCFLPAVFLVDQWGGCVMKCASLLMIRTHVACHHISAFAPRGQHFYSEPADIAN